MSAFHSQRPEALWMAGPLRKSSEYRLNDHRGREANIYPACCLGTTFYPKHSLLGRTMPPDDTIFCTDDGDHSVRRGTPEGKILLTLGTPGTPKPHTGGEPFCQSTHTTL
jgi:hypothetical protein